MSIKHIVEEKLGHAVSQLATVGSIRPVRVFSVSFTTAGELAVTHMPPADTAVVFDGLYCPFDEATLLIDRAVAVDWGLVSHARS
jgi:hypothetical protein